jgi:hypothetical protein
VNASRIDPCPNMAVDVFDCLILVKSTKIFFFLVLFATGDLQLLTYKAACASHMYGREFNYVVEAYNCLERENDRDLFLFLQTHRQNSIGIYSNFL